MPDNKMLVKIQYYGSIRVAAATAEEDILVKADGTVGDVLAQLCAGHTEAFRGEVFQVGQTSLRDDLTLTVNGVIIHHEKVSETPLPQGSVIALLPVFPGGG